MALLQHERAREAFGSEKMKTNKKDDILFHQQILTEHRLLDLEVAKFRSRRTPFNSTKIDRHKWLGKTPEQVKQ